MPSILRKESVAVRESLRATPMLFQWASRRPYECAGGGIHTWVCHSVQVAGIVILICAALYPTVIAPTLIASQPKQASYLLAFFYFS